MHGGAEARLDVFFGHLFLRPVRDRQRDVFGVKESVLIQLVQCLPSRDCPLQLGSRAAILAYLRVALAAQSLKQQAHGDKVGVIWE